MGKNSKQKIVPPLTPEESARLHLCEETICKGLGTFVAVGAALMEIRDARLYRQQHPTFECYVQSVLALSRPRAYELIDSSQVMHDLSAIAGISALPQNEGQARELRRWKTPEERAQKWRAVLDAAGNKPVTAKFIRQTLSPTPASTTGPEDNTRRAKACLTRLRGLVADSPAETKAVKLIAKLEEIVSDTANHAQLPTPNHVQPPLLPVKVDLWLPGFDS